MLYHGGMRSDSDSDSGQTMVEYLLIIVVISAVLLSLFRKLDEYIISNPNSFQNRYLSGFTNVLTGRSGELRGRYKRFVIPK